MRRHPHPFRQSVYHMRTALVLAAAALTAACSDSSTGTPPDETAPTIQIQSPANSFATNGGSATVTGTASDNERITRITYQLNGGTETAVSVSAGATVSFSFPVVLAPGANTVAVHAYDEAGNRSSATVGGTLDAQAPTIQVASLPQGGVVITSSVTVAGTASDNAGVARVTYQVNGGAETDVPITPGASVSFSVSVALGAGDNAIVVNAYDAVGNRTPFQASVEQVQAGAALVAVLDAAGDPVTGAQISAAAQTGAHALDAAVHGNGLYTVEHLGNGTYRVRVPAGMEFTLQVSAPGALTATYRGVTAGADGPTYLETVRLVPSASTAAATATLAITDAFSGEGLGGVSLAVRPGLNTATGSAVATGTTDEDGIYAVTGLAPGYYTVEMTRAGYSSGFFTVAAAGGSAGTFFGSIAPVVAAGQIRIILDWGANPADLDSHLTGPGVDGDDRFHVWYSDMQYADAGGNLLVALDHDDTFSFGPETVTIYDQGSGLYRYSVHDYSNLDATSSTELANSGARVRVYVGGTLVRTFHVPAGQGGTLWTVFELQGSTLTPVNQMSYNSSTGGTVTDVSVSRATLPRKAPGR